ncbi:CMGC family protein kinase [Trichomonas vaginalis G3]|uniref:non-specific serine/threonine protein kinase n=2 Tax=Trichomonas vaginalis TaxID=5722 RepID=A2FBX9_TRIV3|nr:protein kinase [Trichomonas vaginalis G3]AGH16365.1 protein kinase [Trichomonas vaginalis]EAX97578.1 CMGC family protein kinase [Trichomonas vaginalis G3]KAI5516221.1 protein kinase [Trichomonas vaginalis G3]|eukprot:XP_001310508.1 CMGC family protein kinase [Trichomonas vaginalis G3]
MSRGRAVQRDNPSYNAVTTAKVYADACEKRGPEWSEIDNWTLPTASPEPYEIADWVGTGKYSDVFTAYKGDTKVAIKILKPVRPQKYNREAKILLNLRDGPNIVKLYDIVQNPKTLQYSMVFEYVKESDYTDLFPDIKEDEAKLYLYQLLQALDYCHSCGIMHRDVKPLNILFDRSTRKLRLIDWGLAEFYHPETRYNIHVASRHFKPPELLLDYQYYDYSIDMWSFGVTMAGLIFKKTPFFRGNDDLDMVNKICSVLGGKVLENYLEKYGIPLPDYLQTSIFRLKPKKWQSFVNYDNQSLATPDAIDLIDKCIRFDHTERITAAEALAHPYFDSVRNMKIEP